MSELAATSAEPAYLNRLALNDLPFARVNQSAAFYDGSHIKQRRLLLQHLLRATQTPVLLQSAKGSGKTTLLEEMQRQAASDIRYCFVSSQTPNLALDRAITETLEADIIDPDDAAACEAAIRERLLQLRKVNIVPVLVVDDAEQLSATARQQLSEWLQWQDEQPLWQAVLSAETSPEIETVNFQKLDMPLLEMAEVAPYLQQRLEAVGYQGELPFTAKVLRRFYRLSGGNPGRLNQLAHQHLLGSKPSPTNQYPWMQILRKTGRWSGVIIVGLIIIIALIYQQQINQWIAKPEQQETISLPELAEDDEVATVVVGENEQHPPEAARQELADLLAQIPQDEQDLATETETETETPRLAETPADEQAEPSPSSQPQTASTNSAESEAPVAKADAEKNNSPVHGRDWVMQQQSTDYTFQLMGAWEASEVDAFIEKNALTGQVARFTSLRNQKPWHVLIYGVYSGKQAALDASNQWPAPMNTLPTWLRRFDSVQKQIKEKGVAAQ